MALNRISILENAFERFLSSYVADAAGRAFSGGEREIWLGHFQAQVQSRCLDYLSRELKGQGLSFYTISSAGHELNALTGSLLAPTDPCLLHYRSGALMFARFQKSGRDFTQDALASALCLQEDPISGGRHKVWGDRSTWVIPQTSTIASHLPRALGMAYAVARGAKLGMKMPIPQDAIVFVNFGDGSLNHSTAQGAFNAAAWASYQNLPMPVLFCCEDNGLAISVKSPRGWAAHRMAQMHDLAFFKAGEHDPVHAKRTIESAMDYVRQRRKPAFLHMDVVRLLGHAGSDVESGYLSDAEIEANECRDPLLIMAKLLMDRAGVSGSAIWELWSHQRQRFNQIASRLLDRPKLTSSEAVMRPLRVDVSKPPVFPKLPEEACPKGDGKPRHMAVHLNLALEETLKAVPEAVVFGEDVARKGGVYTITKGLEAKFGPGRVFNTLLDEQTILGLGIGMAHLGFLPILEIQYLAYLHNAIDQLRGEACSTQFFSNGSFVNPMVIRIASFGYQKGFGGHFHNENAIAALREIPGLVVLCPSTPLDAGRLLRTAVGIAKGQGKVVALLEPIALYMQKDLESEGDGAYVAMPECTTTLPLGSLGNHGEKNADLVMVSYANGAALSAKAACALKAKGISTRVLDLRYLKPWPKQALMEEVKGAKAVLVVDECRPDGALGKEILLALKTAHPDMCSDAVFGEDSYIPLGPAATLMMPSAESIQAAAEALLAQVPGPPTVTRFAR